jgi:hypothetical protein
MTFRRRVLARYQVVSDFKTSLTRFVGQGHPGDKVDHVLKAFKRLRDQQKIKDAKQKDIDQWKDFEALEKFVAKLDSESTVSRKLGEKTDGAELIAENEGWRVYKLLNHQACMRFGDDTQWCIKKPDGKDWNEYTEQNDFYFFIAKLRPATDRWFKIAMMVDHGGQRLYWDAEDEPRQGAAEVPAALKLPTIEVENAQPKITINGQRVPLDQFALMEGLTVKGDLNLGYTQVEQLPAGLTVGGNLDLSYTQVKQLPAGLTVGRDLDLSYTQVKQLPAGLTVGRDLVLQGTPIELPAGLTVKGDLDLRGTKIEQLPAGLTVGGYLDLGWTKIKQLPAGLTVGGNLYLSDTPIEQLPPDLKVQGTIYADPGLDPGQFSGQVAR